jgi:hypothetical protein
VTGGSGHSATSQERLTAHFTQTVVRRSVGPRPRRRRGRAAGRLRCGLRGHSCLSPPRCAGGTVRSTRFHSVPRAGDWVGRGQRWSSGPRATRVSYLPVRSLSESLAAMAWPTGVLLLSEDAKFRRMWCLKFQNLRFRIGRAAGRGGGAMCHRITQCNCCRFWLARSTGIIFQEGRAVRLPEKPVGVRLVRCPAAGGRSVRSCHVKECLTITGYSGPIDPPAPMPSIPITGRGNCPARGQGAHCNPFLDTIRAPVRQRIRTPRPTSDIASVRRGHRTSPRAGPTSGGRSVRPQLAHRLTGPQGN